MVPDASSPRRVIGRIARLVAFALVLLMPALAAAQSVCTTPATRPEFRTLSADDRDRFFDAVQTVMQRPGGSPGLAGAYDALVQLQLDHAPVVGGRPVVLPFYRALLLRFEQELRAVDPGVRVPYWDTGLDSAAPEFSPVWGDDAFGGDGNPGIDNAVTTGRFSNWRPLVPTEHPLRRNWSGVGDVLPATTSPEAFDALLATATTHDQLRAGLVIAGYAPLFAGIGGDMSTASNTNDPLAWLIYANVDRLWARWQAMQPGPVYDGANADDTPAQVTDVIPGLGPLTVADVLDIGDLCYQYAFEGPFPDPLPPAVLSPATLAGGTVGTPFSVQLTVDRDEPHQFAVTAGALPAGVTLGPAGLLAGTPEAAGEFAFTVTATDAGTASSATRAYQLTIARAAAAIAPDELAPATVGQPYAVQFGANPGQGFAFDISAGALPPGLTLSAGGQLSGTPTAAGSFAVTVRAESPDAIGTRAYTVVVDAAPPPPPPPVDPGPPAGTPPGGPTPPPPGPPAQVPPVVGPPALTPPRVVVRPGVRPPVVRLSVRLDRAAPLRLLVTRRAPGRIRADRCVAPTPALVRARARTCVRALTVATLVRPGRAGVNRIAITSLRVGRRTLAPGVYRLRLTAGRAGALSRAVTTTLRVVRGRP